VIACACVFTAHGEDTYLAAVHINASPIEATFSPHDFIGSHQSINAAEFNQSFNTLSNLLEQQSGIDIKSIGGIGQYSSPIIRGSSGQQVLVFWDGLLINGFNGGSADIGSLSLNLASKINIYRSITPIELSSSAVGGVIHIESKSLTQKEHDSNGEATVTHGSNGVQQYSIMQKTEIAASQWLIAADYSSADNNFSYLENSPVNSPNTPSHEPRYNNATRQYNVLLKGLKSYQDGRIDIALQSRNSNRELSSKINSQSNQADLSTLSESVQLRWKYKWSHLNRSEFLTTLNQQTQLYDDKFSSIGLGEQLNEYRTNGHVFQFNQYLTYNNLSTLITARSQTEKTYTDYKLLNEQELDAQCLAGLGCETAYQRQQHDLAGRIQYQNKKNRANLQISRIFLQDKNLTSYNSLNQYNRTTWSIGVSHQFEFGVNLYLNFANQVRLPSTNELFGDRGLSIGNSELQPEIAEHNEIGLQYQGVHLSVKSSFYLRNIKQAIVGESDSRGVIRYSNLGESRHIGTEHDIHWNPVNHLTFTANLTIQSNEIIEDKNFSYYEGKQVAGYSQVHTFLSARWEKNNWDITLSNTLEREGFYDNANLLTKDKKAQWSASIGANYYKWRLSLDATNLTNSSARDYTNYPEPGRMYFLRAHTQW
jgi:vitamin B12 transporter